MALRKPIFISEQGYSQELDGYADSVQLSAMQIIDADGNQKVSLDGASGDLAVAGEATLASAIISDLTQSRVVFAGADGALVDSANLVYDGALRVGDGTTNTFQMSTTSNMPFILNSGNYSMFYSTQGDIRLELTDDLGQGRISLQPDNSMIKIKDYSDVDRTVIEHGAIRLSNGDTSTLFEVNSAGADVNTSIDVSGQVDLAAAGVATSVRGTLSVAEETTLASAIVSDLTDTRVVFAGANGALVDSSNLVFDGSDLTMASAKVSDLTDTRIVFAGADGALVDNAALTFSSNTLMVGGPANGVISLLNESNVERVNIASNNDGIRMFDDSGNHTVSIRGDIGYIELLGAGSKIAGLVTAEILNANDATNKEYVDGYVADLLLQINAASDSSFSDFTAAESLALGNPVFINSSSKAAKADADFEAKSWVIGVAKAAASAEGAVEIIRDGVCAGALTGLSFAAADQIWLAPGGGLVNAKPTASGARLILVGFAKSADDLFVDIRDYGRNV